MPTVPATDGLHAPEDDNRTVVMPAEPPVPWYPAAAPRLNLPYDFSSPYSHVLDESSHSEFGQGREAMPLLDIPFHAGYNSSFQQSHQNAALSTCVPPVMYDDGMSARYIAANDAWNSQRVLLEEGREKYTGIICATFLTLSSGRTQSTEAIPPYSPLSDRRMRGND
jgi:hypothetical protein